MKYKFLLDENVIYHAVQLIDRQNNFDLTAAELIHLIAKNCHSIVMDKFLWKRYKHILAKLERTKSGDARLIKAIHHLIKNSEKSHYDFQNIPTLTIENGYPKKDIAIVRAAFHFNAFIVTSDLKLKQAVNAKKTKKLRALSTDEAHQLAEEA